MTYEIEACAALQDQYDEVVINSSNRNLRSINRSMSSMSETQSNHSDRLKPTSEFHARLAEKCKQLGVPHYTVEDPSPAHLAVINEIFGSGPVLFTSVCPPSSPSPDHKNASDQELTGPTLDENDG